jgi:methanogenic corrinoid protein MtbC1
MSISRAIELWKSLVASGEDPTLVARPSDDKRPVAMPQFTLGELHQVEELREAWIEACLAFDRERAEGVLTRAFALFPPELVCVQLLQHGLVKIGERWYLGEVTVQQEHFASALSLQRLENLIASSASPWRPEKIIVATAEGDYHTFGSLLFTFLLRRQGWNVIYLGASVPAHELETVIDQVRPHLVILIAQRLHTAATLKDAAQLLQSQRVDLAFGGAAFSQIEHPQRFIPGHFLGHSLEEGLEKVYSLLAHEAEVPFLSAKTRSWLAAVERYTECRAMIEATVRAAFVTAGKPTGQLASINSEFARAIEAALRLGDINLLASDFNGVQDLLISFRWPSDLLKEYLVAYQRAARIHLTDSASVITEWLERVMSA